jgi:hypothetical protein
VDSAAGGVAPAQGTDAVNADALTAGPLLDVGTCAAQTCCRLFGSYLARHQGTDTDAVRTVPARTWGVPADEHTVVCRTCAGAAPGRGGGR